MNGNVHVRFWSRAGMATSRLRQRPQLERGVRSKAVACEGLGSLADVNRALRPTNPLRRPPCAMKAACTVTTGGMRRRAARYRAWSLPTPEGTASVG